MARTIAVYGANGTLGRRVTRELLAQGAEVRLGGRNPAALASVAADLSRDAGWRGTREAAALDDREGLRRLLGGCRVVVNAGPTANGGEALVHAAIDAGVHYIDAAGSQAFLYRVFEHDNLPAVRRGVALAPGFGFDYALGDCLAHLLARVEGGARARHIVVAYAIAGAEVAANSLQFAADTQGGGEWFYENRAWMPARLGVYRRVIEFPPPFGRQPVARYAAGEIVTVPRHTATDAVTTLVTTRSLVPHPALIPFFPYLRPAVALARRTPARRLLQWLLSRRRGPAQDAPREGAGEPPRFAIVVDVEAFNGTHQRGVVEGGDFHRVTVAALAHGAAALASPAFTRTGALPPALVVDPKAFLDALRTEGVAWRRY